MDYWDNKYHRLNLLCKCPVGIHEDNKCCNYHKEIVNVKKKAR